MSKKPPPGDYDVGYGKPPRNTQFKKGQSGNPRGRPRKSNEAMADIFHRVMLKPEPVMMNGKRQRKSGAELIMLQLRSMAIKGDKVALSGIMHMMRMLPLPPVAEANEPRIVHFRFKLGDEETTRRVAEAVKRERSLKLLPGNETED